MAEIIEAEIIEEEEPKPQIVATIVATAGNIEANFDAVEAKVAKLVADYEVVTPENILAMDVKDAKKERAYLNKAKAAIEDERKRIKKEYTAPLNAFEARVKEITALIDKPLTMLGECISMQEQAAKAAKREHLIEVFAQFLEANALEAFAANVTFDMIEQKEWLNASYNMKKAEREVEDAVAAILKDWQGFMSARGTLFCPNETERVFWRTLSLSEALRYDKEQQEAQERINAFHESVGIVDEPEQTLEPEPEPEPEPEQEAIYVVSIEATVLELPEIRKQILVDTMREFGIHGKAKRVR